MKKEIDKIEIIEESSQDLRVVFLSM